MPNLQTLLFNLSPNTPLEIECEKQEWEHFAADQELRRTSEGTRLRRAAYRTWTVQADISNHIHHRNPEHVTPFPYLLHTYTSRYEVNND